MSSVAQGAATKVPDLLDLLAPGEVGLYWDANDRRRWVSVDRIMVLVFCVVGMAFFLAVSVYAAAIMQDFLLSLATGAFFLVLALIFVFQLRQRHQLPPRCDALITETRVLCWHEHTAPSVVEIPMSEIADAEELSSDEGSVRVVKRDGSEIVLTGLENSGRFARLLPVKPELTPPGSAVHFRNMDTLYFLAAQLAFPVLLLAYAIAAGLLTGSSAKGLEAALTHALALPAAAMICFAGLHVARLSMFLNGWRSHSPEAVRCWLGPHKGDTTYERWIRRWVLLNPLYRRLASALYGPPLEAGEGASHG